MTSSAAALANSGRDEWRSAIVGADDEWLVRLLGARPDLVLAVPHDLEALAGLVRAPAHVRQWYEMADRTSRQVLEALCTLAETTDLDTLAGALGVDPGSLTGIMDWLETCGMVLCSGARITRNPGLRAAIPCPAGLGPSVRQTLGARPVRELADTAQRIGLAAKGIKVTLVDAIAAALSSPALVAALVAGGPDGTEEITRQMSQQYLELNIGYGVYQASQSDRRPEGYLLRRSLLVPTSGGSATMPAEVAMAMRGGRLFESFAAGRPDLATTPVDAGRLDRSASEKALALLADVASLLDAWSAEPAKLLQGGGLGIREVRRLAKLTGRTEAEAARLVELAYFAGLVADNNEVVMPTAHFDEWSELEVGFRWAWLAEAWRAAPIHLSLAGAIDTKDKPIPPLLGRRAEPDALARRKLVLGLLDGVAAGQVAGRDQLAERADWRAPALWRGGPARPAQLVSWVLDEAEMLGVTVGGALSSPGRHLVEDDEVAAAQAVLAPPVSSEIVLQGDLTAVVAGELAPKLRRELDLLADVESSGAATVYRFSEASLRRGFDAGRTSRDILDFLAERAPKGVPQPLTYLVEDLERRFGRIRVGAAGCYVRSDDVAMLAEVAQARKASRLHLRLLAPTVAVSDADPATVERTLRDAGYLAAPEDAAGMVLVRRPPAHRAPERAAGPDRSGTCSCGCGRSDDELLAEIFEDPGLLAAVAGLPSAVLESGTLDGLHLLDRGDDRDGDSWDGGGSRDGDEDTAGDPVDLASVVRRLRNPEPRRVRAGTASGPAASPQRQLFSDPLLQLLGTDRPTGIARDVKEIYDLLDQAWDEDWLVRMAYGGGVGSEFYAEVVDMSRTSVRVLRRPEGTSMQLQINRIMWARVATEAEEDTYLP